MRKLPEQYKVLVKKEDLTSRGALPSSQEMYDLMHLTTCEHADQRWKEYWQFCPVCLSHRWEDENGDIIVTHKDREEILV